MYFLRVSDYSKQIKQDNLLQIIESDDYVRLEAERAAEAEILMYLSNNYDLTTVFSPTLTFDFAINYLKGERALDTDLDKTMYYAAQNNTLGHGLAELDYWVQGDNRNALLVMIYVDIVLYHLHSRINPRNIPQLRLDRYDEAKKMLIGFASGELYINLPTYPILSDNLLPIHWGSNLKLRHEY